MGLDLAAFRTDQRKSQRQVANETGLSQPTISRIEKHQQRPSFDVFMAIKLWADDIARRKRLPVAKRLTPGWPVARADTAA
jgi:transcriptional regulator with XRE-family HTH domain